MTPSLSKLERLASQESPSREGARWVALQVAMHVINAVDRRDPHTGEPLPQSLLGCLGAIEAAHLDAIRPVPSDRLDHAVELALGPLEAIIRNPRTKVVREHHRMPVHQLREVDAKCFDTIARLPGRTYREKFSARATTLGVVRRLTPDTHENRVVRRFARLLDTLLEGRVQAIKAGAYDPPGRADDLDRLGRCLRLCRDHLLRSELGAVPASLAPVPNNVLLRDRDYSRVWRAWLWIRAFEEDVDQSWGDVESPFRTALFWMLAAHLAALPGVAVAEDLARVAPGYGGLPYGLARHGLTGGPVWTVANSLTLLMLPVLPSREHLRGHVHRLAKSMDLPIGFLRSDDGSEVYFDGRFLEKGLAMSDLREGDPMVFLTGWNSTRTRRRAIHVARPGRAHRVQLSLEGEAITILSTPLNGNAVLVDGSASLDHRWEARYHLSFDERMPHQANRGTPFVSTREPAESEQPFGDLADLKGMRRFVSRASGELLTALGVSTGAGDVSGLFPSDLGPINGDWLRSAAEVPVPLLRPTLPEKRGQAPGEYTRSQSPFLRPTETETPLGDESTTVEVRPEPARRIGLDLGSALARFDVEGRSGLATTTLHATRHDDPERPSTPEWRVDYHDRRCDPTAPPTVTVSIADIVDPETKIGQETLSTAARRIIEDLRAELVGPRAILHQDAGLAYTVPDGLDEFSQRILRSAAAGSFGHACPVWRNVATVLGWQQSPGFADAWIGDGDVVVVFDAAGALTATLLVARKSENSERLAEAFPSSLGIHWERRPSLSHQSLPPDLRKLAEDLSFPRLLADHLRQAINDDPNSALLPKETLDRIVDRLVRKGAVEAAVCGGRPLWVPVEGVPGVAALHLPADPSGFARRLDGWLGSFRHYLAGLASNRPFLDLLDELHHDGGSIVFLLAGAPAGLPASRRWITPHDLPESFQQIRTWTCPDSLGFAASGARNLLDRVTLGLPGWYDWLPDLYLDVARDGQFHELQLLQESQAAATLGEVLRCDVSETLLLPAGQASYRFPLLSGRRREPLPYDAVIASDRFPLAEDTKVRLVLTYRYGLDNAYELTVYPSDPALATFPPLTAQWSHRARPLSASPPFPSPRSWSSYTDLIEKQNWFVIQSRKFVDRCESLFPKLPETTEHLRYFERSKRTGDWMSFAEWMGKGLETPMRISWDEGRVLADAPEAFAKAADADFFDWLLNLAGLLHDQLPEDIWRHPRYRPEIWQIRNIALMLLCRLHRDTPPGVAGLMDDELRRAADRALKFNQDWVLDKPLDHIKFLLGDGQGAGARSLPLLVELMQSYFHSNPRAPAVQVSLIRLFSVALWRNERFVHSLASELPGVVPGLLDTIQQVFEGLGTNPASPIEIRLFIFGSQVVLGLLRLRESPEYVDFLGAGSPGLVRIARHVRRLDRTFAEAGVRVWSNVQFDLNKPQALRKMSDLAYALNCYLTGDFGSGLIGIASVCEEP